MRLSLFVVSVAVFVGSSTHVSAAKLGARQSRTTPLLTSMLSHHCAGLWLTMRVVDFPGQAPLPSIEQHSTQRGANLLPLDNIQGDILYVVFLVRSHSVPLLMMFQDWNEEAEGTLRVFPRQ